MRYTVSGVQRQGSKRITGVSSECQRSGRDKLRDGGDRAVPDDIKAEREAAAWGKKTGQRTLDAMGVKKVQVPTQFSPEAILQSVTEHVVCGYQVRHAVLPFMYPIWTD